MPGLIGAMFERKGIALLMAMLLVAACAACSDDPPDTKDTAAVDATGDGAEQPDGGGTDVLADTAEKAGDDGKIEDGGETLDTGGDEEIAVADTDGGDPLDGGNDGGPTLVDVPTVPEDTGPQCQTAADCTAKVQPKACEQPKCDGGVCTVELKPGSCCEDTHCNDAKECTADNCVQATHTCEHKLIPNCCSGKLTLAKVGFEGDLGGLATKESPTNGNVKWQLTSKRKFKGAQSLHFGNACGTYNNAMKTANNCADDGKGSAVSGSLTTKAFQLPADKQTQLHFWLFMDVEPMYADTLPKGKCATPCKTGSSCININGKSACLPEKDNLVVQVVADKSGTVTVFDSTWINKTTAGKWQRVLVDLAAFTGKTVQLRWSFSTGTKHKNSGEGVFLDMVVLETVCAVQGTLCAPTVACLNDGNPCTSEACSVYSNKTGGAGICFHDKKAGCCTNADECNDGQPCTADTCDKGTCSNQPDTAKPGCCKPKVLHNDDFESGVLTDWQLTSNSQGIKWRIHPSGGAAKSQALYFGNSSFDSYADPTLGKGKGPKGTACTKEFTFAQGTLYNLVSFKLKMVTEFSFLPKSKYKNPPLFGKPKYDFLFVTAEVGGKSHELWTSDLIYGTTDGEWLDVVAPVPAKLQGQTAKVCLTFQAGDDKVNDKYGVAIDLLLVRVTCQIKACYFDAQCSGKCAGCELPGCADGACGCKKIAGCCALDKDCASKDPCTANTCVANKCLSKPIEKCCKDDKTCTASDKCKLASCDPGKHQCIEVQKKDCCIKSADCEDFDPCTLPSCNEKTSTCSFKPVPGCCSQDSDCNDKDKCTADNCIDGKCYYKKSAEPGCPK